jgi:putative endonuclease
MPANNSSYVYILANHSKALYVGVTSDLEKRVWRHQYVSGGAHTSRFNINQLVWFEQTDDVRVAISREKHLKRWRRAWKVGLIETENPDWNDLAEAWFDSRYPESSSG